MEQCVPPRQRQWISVVPAADDARDGDAAAHTRLDDVPVAAPDAGVRQLEVAEPVALPHVDARVVQHLEGRATGRVRRTPACGSEPRRHGGASSGRKRRSIVGSVSRSSLR